MRQRVAMVAVLVLVLGMLGVQPAGATHGCTTPGCNPVSVSVIEGIGNVCSAADPLDPCVYHKDAFWSGATTGISQGLYWPRVGPPAKGPFAFSAGTAFSPPTSVCVSSIGGLGCSFNSSGDLTPGASGIGAYCGSSKGVGTSKFVSAGGAVTTNATFGWEQSAATILPLQGKVTSSTPAGGAGATVVGFTSSRGTEGGGNCGITQVTTKFNVEGMVVTF